MLQTAEQLLRARALLDAHTFAACSDTEIDTDTARGVAPLLTRLAAGRTLMGFAVADRVVGAGGAYLYVLLAPAALHARVLSRPALAVLERYRVPVTWDVLVDHIRNRTGTGTCPMERAVEHVTDPQAAAVAIRATLAQLNKGETDDLS